MSGLSYGSLADLLAFEAWPEEMQRIARAAVADECDEPHEEVISEAIEDQKADDQQFYELVRKHLAVVVKKLREAKAQVDDTLHKENERIDAIDASVTTAIEMLEALPETLVEMKEEE